MSDFGFLTASAPNGGAIVPGVTPIIGGVVGRVLFEGAGNVVQESSSLFWDNTNNRLGIGTSSPAYALEISSASGSQTAGILVKNTGGGSSDYSSLNLLNNNNILSQVFNTSSGYTISPVIGANGFGHYTNGSGGITLWADGGIIKFITGTGANAVGSQKMTLATTGNLLINTTTDAGFRLDVNGTARVSVSTANTGITLASNVTGNTGNFTITPNSTAIGSFGDFTMSTPNGTRLFIGGNYATIFTSSNNVTVNNALIVGGNLSVGGSGISVIQSTSLFLGANGNTSSNVYFTTGGTTEAKILWRLNNLGSFGRTDLFLCINNTASTSLATIADAKVGFLANGNVLIGTTTDAGFRLDVNGTARVSGALTLGTGTAVASSISYGSTYGLTLYGNTGSNSDLLLTDRNGNLRFRIVNGGNILQTSSVINDISIGVVTSVAKSITADATYGMTIRGGVGSIYNLSLVENTGNNGLFIDSSGNTKIGAYNSTYNNSAILEAVSTTQGFLPPRMTTTQKNAIATPAAGLQVFDTTLNQMSYYNGTTWTNI